MQSYKGIIGPPYILERHQVGLVQRARWTKSMSPLKLKDRITPHVNFLQKHKADVNIGWERMKKQKKWWKANGVKELCLTELCVKELCVAMLCVKELCVKKLCVKGVCVWSIWTDVKLIGFGFCRGFTRHDITNLDQRCWVISWDMGPGQSHVPALDAPGCCSHSWWSHMTILYVLHFLDNLRQFPRSCHHLKHPWCTWMLLHSWWSKNGNSFRLAFLEQLKAIPSVLPSIEATWMHLDAAASLVVKNGNAFCLAVLGTYATTFGLELWFN